MTQEHSGPWTQWIPGAPLGLMPKRRMRPAYAKWVGLLGVAFVLWALHGAFHVLADWVGYGYDNPLGTLFGPNPIGANAHVLLELVIGFALGTAFIREVIRWRHS